MCQTRDQASNRACNPSVHRTILKQLSHPSKALYLFLFNWVVYFLLLDEAPLWSMDRLPDGVCNAVNEIQIPSMGSKSPSWGLLTSCHPLSCSSCMTQYSGWGERGMDLCGSFPQIWGNQSLIHTLTLQPHSLTPWEIL